MRFLELKFPPLALTLFIGWLMWLASRYVPMFGQPLPVLQIVALVPAAAGVAIAVFGIVSFRRAHTTTNPLRPENSSALVTSGVYKWTRNPMYLGALLVLTGWALFLANALTFVLLPVFVAYLSRFQIIPEEAVLTARFGAEFDAYRARVRRWI